MRQQRVGERVGGIARSGMHNETGRFVDHDEALVLVEDLERNVLGLEPGFFRGRQDHLDNIANLDRVMRFDKLPIERGEPFLNELLGVRP